MYMQSNQPYQDEKPGVGAGFVWGGMKGAAIGGAYSALNQYALKGNLDKMKNVDVHIPAGATFWRGMEKSAREWDHQVNNHDNDVTRAETTKTKLKDLPKQKSPFAKMYYNTTFAHGKSANIKRTAVGALFGAGFGALHNASNGIVQG